MWFCLFDILYCEFYIGKNNVFYGYNGISVSKYLLNEIMINRVELLDVYILDLNLM